MPGIFISYRREDSAGYTGRIYDRLSARFGKDQIFMDIDTELVVDFVDVINEKVGFCDVLVSVIGRNWLTVTNSEGQRRLDNPEDFVRLENEAALERNVPVIPALVGGATIPRKSDLPEALANLTRRHAIEISHTRFDQDMDRLIRGLERILPPESEALGKKRKSKSKTKTKDSPSLFRRLGLDSIKRWGLTFGLIFGLVLVIQILSFLYIMYMMKFLSVYPDEKPNSSSMTSPAKPTVTISTSPTTIQKGQSSTLSWTSADAESVTIDSGIGDVSRSGSRKVSPRSSTTYKITAKGDGGMETASASVRVTSPPPAPAAKPTVTIFAKPTTIPRGRSATLTWKATNSSTVSIQPGVGDVSESGSRRVQPSSSTTYTISARGKGGKVTASARINVMAKVNCFHKDLVLANHKVFPFAVISRGIVHLGMM